MARHLDVLLGTFHDDERGGDADGSRGPRSSLGLGEVARVVRSLTDFAVVATLNDTVGVVELVRAAVTTPLPRDPKIHQEPRKPTTDRRTPPIPTTTHRTILAFPSALR